MAFSYSEAEEIQKTIAKERRNELIITGVKYALTIIALLIIFLFILKPFLKTVMTKVKPPEELTSGFPESVAVAEGGEVSETYGEPGAVGGTGIESAPPEKTPEDIVKEIIESNPDKVAQVVKQWLRSK